MTDGILAPERYYYRRLITDAVRAIEAVRAHPAVDPARVAVMGGSQGGGLAIAVAGLLPDLLAAMPDVPFLSDFPRAIRLVDTQPYVQIATYLKVHRDRVAQVERTLSYVDAAILGRTATAPAPVRRRVDGHRLPAVDRLRGIQLVLAARRRSASTRFNDHESGGETHEAANDRLGSATSSARPG